MKNETELIAEGLQQLNRKAIQAAAADDYEGALNLFRQALEFEVKLKFNVHAAETMMNIATTCLLLKEYSEAMNAAEEAEQMFREQRKQSAIRRAATLKGTILLCSGSYEGAARQLETCLRQAHSAEERGAIYAMTATAFFKLQQQHRAQEYFGRAVAEYDQINDVHGAMSCLRQRAAFFNTIGRKDLATRDLNRCASLAGAF